MRAGELTFAQKTMRAAIAVLLLVLGAVCFHQRTEIAVSCDDTLLTQVFTHVDHPERLRVLDPCVAVTGNHRKAIARDRR
jgi:hypothetical protein